MSNNDEALLPADAYGRLRAPASASARALQSYARRHWGRSSLAWPLGLGAACALLLALLVTSASRMPGKAELRPLRAPQLTDLKLPSRPPMPTSKPARPEGAVRVPRLSELNLTKLKTAETRS